MDLRLSGFMQGHYPLEPASSKARLNPDGSLIPTFLREKQGFSWLCRFLLFGEGLDACLEMICGNGRIQTWLGDMGVGGLQGWQKHLGGARLIPANVDRKIISFRIKIISRFALCSEGNSG